MARKPEIISTELESKSTEDIINTPPSWILRSGISMLAGAVFIFIILSATIRFPDKISAQGSMTSETPPIEHKAKIGGIVDTIFVKHNSYINEGEPILLLKNHCSVNDISKLENFFLNFSNIDQKSQYLSHNFPFNLQLGDLQSEYANLEFMFLSLRNILSNSNTQEQIAILETEINQLDIYNSAISRQKDFSEKEFILVNKNHSRNINLKKENIISDLDFERSNLELVDYQKKLNSYESSLIENEIRKGQLRLRIFQLEADKSENLDDIKLKIQETISRLKENIEKWKSTYIISSEISGIVSINSTISKRVNVIPNESIAQILPSNASSRKFVRAFIPGKAIGKLKVGNKVILKIEGYPYREFGTVSSFITDISLLPTMDQGGDFVYEISAPLNNTIKTHYGVEIPYVPNTLVVIEVIIEDVTILHRVFNQFLNLIYNK